MKYYIFIDESGSMGFKKEEPFSVTLVIVPEKKFKLIKKQVKKKLGYIKQKIGISLKKELKATNLNKSSKRKLLIDFVDVIDKKGIKHVTSYFQCGINMKDSKWLLDKNATFNFMIRCALERAISKSLIELHSKIDIVCDNRNIATSYVGSLATYLRTEFILNLSLLSEVKVEFKESHLNWGIQMADLVSYYTWRNIKANILNNHIRKIHQ